MLSEGIYRHQSFPFKDEDPVFHYQCGDLPLRIRDYGTES
jgi:hypothetical protein